MADECSGSFVTSLPLGAILGLMSLESSPVIPSFCPSRYKRGEGDPFTMGNLCPAFRQMGRVESFFCGLFLGCIQFKTVLMPKWHNLG